MASQSPTETEPAPPTASDAPSPQQRGDMLRAIVTQCLGAHMERAFENGILLLYFLALGLSDAQIMLALAFPPIAHALSQMPLAYLADRVGKKSVGVAGLAVQPVGFAMLLAAGWFGGSAMYVLIACGLLLFAVGLGGFTAGWFALLSAIVPASMRGRFFGRLRFSWMATAIAFTAVATFILSTGSPIWQFQLVLGLITLAATVRVFVYAPITEMESPQRTGEGFWRALVPIVRSPQFTPFVAYTFLLLLFAGGGPWLFGLIEKRVLGMSEGTVVALGATMMVGMLVGFWFSGGLIDRIGTRIVFVVCHLGFAASMGVLLFRDLLPVDAVWFALVAHVGYGVCMAASSVAMASELLALIPAQNKALSTSLWWAFQRAGKSLSGGAMAAALSLGLLAESWTWLGEARTSYDALLLAFSGLVALMVVTLGLVPSVVGKAGWVPQ